MLAVGADGGYLDILSLLYHFSLLSPSLEDGQYRLKYCLKGLLNPKQPTNQSLCRCNIPGDISISYNKICYMLYKMSNLRYFNPIALSTAKTPLSFGLSECNRVNRE